MFFFFKQTTAYELRISDWSSDVCSSDLGAGGAGGRPARQHDRQYEEPADRDDRPAAEKLCHADPPRPARHAAARAANARRAYRDSRSLRRPRPRSRRGGDRDALERKSVMSGKGGSVREEPGGRRPIKKKNAE